jgi:hypothetical protein
LGILSSPFRAEAGEIKPLRDIADRRFYVAKGAISVPAGEPVTPLSKEARFVRIFALWDLSVRRPDPVYDFK